MQRHQRHQLQKLTIPIQLGKEHYHLLEVTNKHCSELLYFISCYLYGGNLIIRTLFIWRLNYPDTSNSRNVLVRMCRWWNQLAFGGVVIID